MSTKLRTAVLLAVLVPTAAYAKHKGRGWQQGKLIATDASRYFAGTVGSASTNGSISESGDSGTYSGQTTSSQRAVYRVYQDYVIETDQYVYIAEERLRWRWSKPANLTVNGPVQYAIEKNKMFILDEDAKEHEARVVKKILKLTK